MYLMLGAGRTSQCTYQQNVRLLWGTEILTYKPRVSVLLSFCDNFDHDRRHRELPTPSTWTCFRVTTHGSETPLPFGSRPSCSLIAFGLVGIAAVLQLDTEIAIPSVRFEYRISMTFHIRPATEKDIVCIERYSSQPILLTRIGPHRIQYCG